jgi:hypothetical protein
MTIDIDDLKKRYPNPSRGRNKISMPFGCYCVGGAFLHYLQNYFGLHAITAIEFPSSRILADGIQVANPSLTLGGAIDYALWVIAANDSGRFGRAWELLDEAINTRWRQ